MRGGFPSFVCLEEEINCQTIVLTEMGKRAWGDPGKGGPKSARVPVGRFAESEDVAAVVCFLLTDGQLC
jgi:L-xylulose reductase